MAKAMNPRKPARDKRKSGAAAKRSASKRATRARKFAKSSAPGSGRVSARPSGGRAMAHARRVQATEPRMDAPAVVPEAPRVPPPLPVPIASFTF